jgi:hypothetical protein
MKNTAQRKLPLQGARPAYRTLQGWALGTLLEEHAVRQCEHHGYAVDRGGRRSHGSHQETVYEVPRLYDSFS